MTGGFKLFDAYNLKARIYPALIAGLPVLGLLIVLVPWDHLGLPHALAAAMSGVLLFAFADLARRCGKRVEIKLGSRTTPELLFRGDSTIDEPLKARYREFLSKKIDTPIPTEAQEREDPAKANVFYNSALTWLRENTRDTKKFVILFNENIAYGFRRNLLGLKNVSIALNAAVIFISSVILYYRPKYFADIPEVDSKIWTVVGVAIIHSLYMAFGVNKATVLEASAGYGRQLILCCEHFLTTTGTAAAKPKRSTVATKKSNDS